ncbi:MAG: hypothetical protein ACO3B3_11905 [Cyanobium sp.]
MVGLYDQQGVLRFAGRDHDDCLAYAELFALSDGSFSLESLLLDAADVSGVVRPGAGCSN